MIKINRDSSKTLAMSRILHRILGIFKKQGDLLFERRSFKFSKSDCVRRTAATGQDIFWKNGYLVLDKRLFEWYNMVYQVVLCPMLVLCFF